MNKENVSLCLNEVSNMVKDFLEKEGGNDNHETYVRGMVKNDDKEGTLEWRTPISKEEITPQGLKNRGTKLYKNIQEVLKKYEIEKLELRATDIPESYGGMRTEVIHVVETKKTIL